MDKEIKTWLYDILQSIDEIDSYYDNKPKIFKEYLSDTKTKRAIERCAISLSVLGKHNITTVEPRYKELIGTWQFSSL